MAETPGSGSPPGSSSGPPPTPQRKFVAPCPNCGAPVPFVSAASAMAVCGYCRSTVLREGDSLRKIGESAELFDDHSRLQIGATGTQGARGFTIVGRVQYGYGDGPTPDATWNEWYLAFGDSRSGWLSEDNDQYVLVFDVELDKPPPASEELQVGQALWLVGLRWTVASIVEARALAAQGELPSPPALGQHHTIADLRNEQAQVATLDYADPAKPGFSIGQNVRLADLRLQGLRDDQEAGTKTLKAEGFPCPSCGAPIEAKLEQSRSITCNNCHSLVDVSKGAGGALSYYQQNRLAEPLIPIGNVGTLAFAGSGLVDWQVVGFSVKQANAGDPDESFSWQDYLLYNEQEGFAFLIDSDEGWVGFRTLTGVPKTDGAGAIVEWSGARYRRSDQYPATVQYVEGEFYWLVQRAQVTHTTDYKGLGSAANRRLSSERTDNEIVWSEGTTIPAAQVAQAFRLSNLPGKTQSIDISPLSGGQTISWVVWLVVIIILLLVLSECGSSFGGGGYYYGTGGGSYGGYSSGGGHK